MIDSGMAKSCTDPPLTHVEAEFLSIFPLISVAMRWNPCHVVLVVLLLACRCVMAACGVQSPAAAT